MAIHANWTVFLYEAVDAEQLEAFVPDLWNHFRSLEEEGDQFSTTDLSKDDPPTTEESVIRLESGRVWGSVYRSTGTDLEYEEVSPDLPQLRLKIDGKRNFRRPLDMNDDIVDRSPAYSRRVSDAIDLITEIYLALDPRPDIVYTLTSGYINTILERDIDDLPVTEECLAEKRLKYFPWLVIFPPPFVESYGRDHLLETPVWRAEELEDESVLLVGGEDIVNKFDVDHQEIREHLGLENPLAHLG